MRVHGITNEDLQRDERTANAGVCPACLHKLKSGVWFSIILPDGKEERLVGCPWCVDMDGIRRDAPDAAAGIEDMVRKYRRGEE